MNVGNCSCTETRIDDGVAKYHEIDIVQGDGEYLRQLFPDSCTQSNGKSKYFIACHNHHAWNEISENASSSTTILFILAVVCCLILLAVVIILYRKVKNLEGKLSNRNIENEVGIKRPSQS